MELTCLPESGLQMARNLSVSFSMVVRPRFLSFPSFMMIASIVQCVAVNLMHELLEATLTTLLQT